eukprot:362006-Chlamydomonas_euryale.AAC.2
MGVGAGVQIRLHWRGTPAGAGRHTAKINEARALERGNTQAKIRVAWAPGRHMCRNESRKGSLCNWISVLDLQMTHVRVQLHCDMSRSLGGREAWLWQGDLTVAGKLACSRKACMALEGLAAARRLGCSREAWL